MYSNFSGPYGRGHSYPVSQSITSQKATLKNLFQFIFVVKVAAIAIWTKRVKKNLFQLFWSLRVV
jgi:hypothetical protein